MTKVTVVGPDLKVEREVDEQTALRVIAILLGGGKGAPAASRDTEVGSDGSQDKIALSSTTISELFSQVRPSSNPSRIATVGYHLRQTDREPFSRETIRLSLRDARQRAPANFSRDLDDAIRSGWLDGTDKSGYVLTTQGIGAVESRFAEEPSRAPAKRRVAKKSPEGKQPAVEKKKAGP